MQSAWLFEIVGGILVANVLLTPSSWVTAIVDIRCTYASGHPWRMMVLTSLFNAGPWALPVAGIFVYYEHAAEWAPWFFGGAALWFLYMGGFLLAAYFRNRGKWDQNAA